MALCHTDRIAGRARRSTLVGMDTRRDTGGERAEGTDQSQFFRALRERNERRSNLGRQLDAQRRQRIERVLQVTRQRRFPPNG